MPKKKEYKPLWVSKKTHKKVKVAVANAEEKMTIDEFIDSLI